MSTLSEYVPQDPSVPCPDGKSPIIDLSNELLDRFVNLCAIRVKDDPPFYIDFRPVNR